MFFPTLMIFQTGLYEKQEENGEESAKHTALSQLVIKPSQFGSKITFGGCLARGNETCETLR